MYFYLCMDLDALTHIDAFKGTDFKNDKSSFQITAQKYPNTTLKIKSLFFLGKTLCKLNFI